MPPVKVGIVNYLNTKPLLFGLNQLEQNNSIVLVHDYPSRLFERFQQNEVSIALLPIATLKLLPGADIIADYGIAARHDVASVCLYSQVPLEQIKCIYLDYQSRTSVELIKILCREYWKIDVEYKAAPENYIDLIQNDTAGLIIGDRALQQLKAFNYVYDLAGAWQALTGLPFVFAAWISRQQYDADFIKQFNEANAVGLSHIDEIAQQNKVDYYPLEVYYTRNISYTLAVEERKAIALFLSKIQ